MMVSFVEKKVRMYKRRCVKCDEIYPTTAKFGKLCDNCRSKKEGKVTPKRLELLKQGPEDMITRQNILKRFKETFKEDLNDNL